MKDSIKNLLNSKRFLATVAVFFAVLFLVFFGLWANQQGYLKINDPEVLTEEATQLADDGNKEEALAKIDKAIEAYGTNEEKIGALYVRASICKQLTDNQCLINSYNRLLELEPESIESYTTLGTAYQENGQHEKALEYFKKALNLMKTEENKETYKEEIPQLEYFINQYEENVQT